jgi:hypothetical protein
MRWIGQLATLLADQLSRSVRVLDSATRRLWRLGFAIALIVGPLVVGIMALSQQSPQRVEPSSVGVVPPVAARPARGFTVGLVARLNSCDQPLDVTVVAAGTAEYWIDNAARMRGRSRFRLALPGVLDRKVEVRTGTTAGDVVDPDTTRLRRGDAPLVAPPDFRVDPVQQRGDLTIVSGAIKNWPATLVPIIAEFRADWIEERGIGTCFIHLPAIAGDLSILSAQRALGKARHVRSLIVGPNDLTVDSRRLGIAARYRPGLEVAYGSATVRVDNGSIDSDESLPAPGESVNGNPTWTCSGRARSTKALAETSSARASDTDDYVLLGPDPLGSAGALSTAALRARPAGDCSAVVAASEASAQWKRDLVLLLIGAFVSLGVTILVEFALAARAGTAAPEAS